MPTDTPRCRHSESGTPPSEGRLQASQQVGSYLQAGSTPAAAASLGPTRSLRSLLQQDSGPTQRLLPKAHTTPPTWPLTQHSHPAYNPEVAGQTTGCAPGSQRRWSSFQLLSSQASLLFPESLLNNPSLGRPAATAAPVSRRPGRQPFVVLTSASDTSTHWASVPCRAPCAQGRRGCPGGDFSQNAGQQDTTSGSVVSGPAGS